MKIDPVIEKVAGFIAENSTTILTATGIASFISSTAFAIKSTRDAAWVYEKASDEAMYMDCSKVRKMAHVAKAVVPLYIPTAVTAGIGILCVAMANKINLDDKAALVAAYSMSKDALDSYQKNVSKRFGQEAHEDILDSIAEEDKGQFDDDIWLDAPGAGSVRVYDHVTGVRFFSDKAKIEQAEVAGRAGGEAQRAILRAWRRRCEQHRGCPRMGRVQMHAQDIFHEHALGIWRAMSGDQLRRVHGQPEDAEEERILGKGE